MSVRYGRENSLRDRGSIKLFFPAVADCDNDDDGNIGVSFIPAFLDILCCCLENS
jgi:hypothetical protein